MSIFHNIERRAKDPIFGLSYFFQQDPRQHKIDLMVGIYRNQAGRIESMRCVKQAKQQYLIQEDNPSYLPIRGIDAFIAESQNLILSKPFVENHKKYLQGFQTLGGTGALRLGGELLAAQRIDAIHIPNYTWPNHLAIFKACGMKVSIYPYYQRQTHTLDFASMLDDFAKLPKHTPVILHCGCHNPTGCDPTHDQWEELSLLFLKKKLLPFFDIAYQGFDQGIEEDVWPVRYFAQQGHELLISHTFSKSLSLYGQRVGTLHVLLKEQTTGEDLVTVAQDIIRTNYSNPPRYGADLASYIMQNPDLKQLWVEEMQEMRSHIQSMRISLFEAFQSLGWEETFLFLKKGTGLFALLGLNQKQLNRLIDEYGIYLISDGRINLSALQPAHVKDVSQAIIDVLK